MRFHFGHGGGYMVEQKPSHGDVVRWGPKSPGGGHCKHGSAAVALEFSEAEVDETDAAETPCDSASTDTRNGLRLLLWSDLGSSFSLAPPEYVHAVEARSAFDINADRDKFKRLALGDDSIRMFQASEELVVDLIMDQSRLPGVGNIIKCEGLFMAGIFPLRRASELTDTEWRGLLGELYHFSDLWYRHCQRSEDGQNMGCCHLMRIYGHKVCSRCSCPVSLIKEGRRQRITYFCPHCQPMPNFRLTTERVHRQELALQLPLCMCGTPPVLLQVRAGNYAGYGEDRRPYLSCQRRRGSSYDDGGCGMPGPWDGCGFHAWLDEVAELPACHCQKPALLRRVMSVSKENGRYFLRCASRSCKFRCWLKLTEETCAEDTRKSTGRWRRHAATHTSDGGSSSHPETSSSEKDSQPWEELSQVTEPLSGPAKPKRWGSRQGYLKRCCFSLSCLAVMHLLEVTRFGHVTVSTQMHYLAQAACLSTPACRIASWGHGRPKAGLWLRAFQPRGMLATCHEQNRLCRSQAQASTE